jgi:alpha,alpha-trehalase
MVHSWVLARSDRTGSWRLFVEALKSDYSDIQGGTTSEGIHLGAMAGSVNILQEGYTGMEPRDDVLWFNPCLPEELERLNMGIRYRGHTLELAITQKEIAFKACRCRECPIKIGVKGETFEIRGGESKNVALS